MPPDFVTELGLPFLAHRLRRTSEMFVAGYGQWLTEAGITAPPRSMSALLLLRQESPLSITTVAERLKFTHPLIITLLSQLEERGLTVVTRDPDDRRRRLVSLTTQGRLEADRVEAALEVIGRAYQALFAEAGVDLLDSLSRIEDASRASSFVERLRRAAADRPPASGDQLAEGLQRATAQDTPQA